MTQPIVGISGSWITDQGGMFPGYHRSYVNDDYIDSVVQAGGIPFIIPVNTQTSIIQQQISHIDALILSGGHDLVPQYYGEEPHQTLTETFENRDIFDFQLVKYAEEKQIPILGICRGAQVLAVYHGGTLYQDLSEYPHTTLQHVQKTGPDHQSHTIDVDKNSIFYSIFGNTSFKVNSFHHQIIKALPQHLHACIYAKDGVIEGFENTTYASTELAVQWHPEMLHRNDPKMQSLFQYIVQEAKGAHV